MSARPHRGGCKRRCTRWVACRSACPTPRQRSRMHPPTGAAPLQGASTHPPPAPAPAPAPAPEPAPEPSSSSSPPNTAFKSPPSLPPPYLPPPPAPPSKPPPPSPATVSKPAAAPAATPPCSCCSAVPTTRSSSVCSFSLVPSGLGEVEEAPMRPMTASSASRPSPWSRTGVGGGLQGEGEGRSVGEGAGGRPARWARAGRGR